MPRFVSPLALASMLALATTFGCAGADSVSPSQNANSNVSTTTTKTGSGSDSSHVPTPVSNGPVVMVTVSPHIATITVGSYVTLAAVPRDANGVMVGVAQSVPQWRSSNPSIATVASDTGLGVVHGVALGTATIYATINNHTDSAAVTVLAAPPPRQPSDSQPSASPPASQQPPVSQFNLTIIVGGSASSTDSSNAGPVAGATVEVSKFAAPGDSVTPGPVLATGITDASGSVHFTQLPGGSDYSIHITAPSGSPYQNSIVVLGPPLTANVTTAVTLTRQP